ncbi:efflux RND transporter permease subunit [Cytobacillus sp. IB215316]|uniref:efflux RND transporter permease subunit n=1 Tax=Cytobacillus sp. IB215316 TaxID=3097354 RepID=UPI002A0DE34D|nr:efflux RND transporter permease subunit [Cytobacillus sp. IB215316]MDX8362194.1 efflux RND transporter permease subunit [Cytobacillus sp. IB215316]
MHLLKTAVQRPVSVIMLAICVIIIGMISLRDIPLDLLPEIEENVVTVSTTYSSASPQEIEKLITEPLEKQIASLDGVESISSTSRTGASSIIIEYSTSIELDEAVSELQQKLSRVSSILPDDADAPAVSKFDINSMPIIYLGLTGKDVTSLEQIAKDIAPNFEKIEGVAAVDIEGGEQREIQVIIEPLLLEQYNLTVSDVVNSMRGKNTSATVGDVIQGNQVVQIRVDGEYQSIDDIKATLIPLASGKTIAIEEVATISDTVSDRQTITRLNHEPTVLLSISKQSGTNTVNISDAIHEELNKVQRELDEGVEFIVVMDTSTFIKDSIDGVTTSLLAGGAFAILVLLFFLRSVRATAVIGLSIPFAIICTFILVNYADQTLNIITLSGLALGIGMMVDSSIVILENITKYRQTGMDSKQAAIKGGSELISAVIASTSTTLVVFLPMILIDNGQITQIFLPLALVVSFSLIAALLVAMTLVPMMSSTLLKSSTDSKVASDPRWMKFLKKRYLSTLTWSLKRRWIVILSTFLLTVGSLFLIAMLKLETFPQAAEDQLTISSSFDSGTDFEVVEGYADEVEKILVDYENNIDIQYTVVQPTSVSVTLLLLDEKERNMDNVTLANAIQNDLKKIIGADFSTRQATRGVNGGADFTIRLSGPEQEVLNSLTEQVELLLSRIPSIENVEVPSVNGQPQLTVKVDDALAEKYHLSQSQIIGQISEIFHGNTATKLRENGDEFDVVVKLPDSETESMEALSSLLLKTPSGQHIPLTSVAAVEQTLGPVSIKREDQRQQYAITADIVDSADARQVTAQVEQLLSQIPAPKGYDVTTEGVQQDFNESLGNLLITLALAIFLVYTVMAIQFESFSYPFIVMFSVPTTIVGVILGLFITGTALSFSAFIGLIVLAGIVVNNAIVLVDYINQLKREGKERKEAIILAGGSRLRPILMTTSTTVLGMLPIALGIGEGSEMQQPIGIVVIFGLTVSMCFTLLFVPVMYTIIDDMGSWFKRLFTRKKASQASNSETIAG